MNYHDEYQQSIEQPEVFWRKQAEQISCLRMNMDFTAGLPAESLTQPTLHLMYTSKMDAVINWH